MIRNLFLSFLLSIFCLAAWAQSTATGSPCSQQTQAHPFCTDDNPFGVSYPAETTGNANAFFNGQSRAGCLGSTPGPAWYYMQIQQSGSLTFHITHSGDVDFACWGPFTADDQADFMNNLCTGQYTLYNPSSYPYPPNNTASDAAYPYGNLADCSFDPAAYEYCHIPNAQQGEWYLLLITNYSHNPGNISFTPTNGSTATTNCNLLNSGDSNSPVCEGQTLKLYVTEPVNGATYNWTGPNGFSQSTTETTLDVPNVTPNMAGTYNMTMSGISQNSNTAVVDVTITPLPPADIIADHETLCYGDSVNLSAGGYLPRYEYMWSGKSLSDGTPVSLPSNVASHQLHPTESHRYYLTVIDDVCPSKDSIDIIVNELPVIGIDIAHPFLCFGESTSITVSGGAHYQWSNGSTNSTINVTPDQTTSYTVEVKTAALCEGDTTIEIIVNPDITEHHEVFNDHCNQGIGSITMHARGGSGMFTYTCNTATFIDSIASNLRKGNYTVTATDSMGCTLSSTIEVDNVPGPTPDFRFASNDNVNMIITNITQGNNNAYYWDFGDGVTSSETHPIHEYMEPGRYTVRLEVIDEYNCIDSLSQDYIINGPVYIANAFTPNGDGINDVIEVVGKTIQNEDFLWVIYDRHGQLVFISYFPSIQWDGTLSNGRDASPGVYTYRLKYKDVNGNYFERDGNITLIR